MKAKLRTFDSRLSTCLLSNRSVAYGWILYILLLYDRSIAWGRTPCSILLRNGRIAWGRIVVLLLNYRSIAWGRIICTFIHAIPFTPYSMPFNALPSVLSKQS